MSGDTPLKTIGAALGATRRNLFYILNSPKLWAAGLLIFYGVFSLVEPYAKAAWALGEDVSIGILAYNFSRGMSILDLYLALLLIFSELPFKDPQQTYLIMRSGKRAWYLSQIFYIIAVSVSVTLIISLVSAIILTGHLSFGNAWGNIITKGANGGLYKYGVVGLIPSGAHKTFSPYAALAWSLPVGTLTMTAFGSIVFSLNSLFRGSVGTVAGAVIIALTLIGRFLGVTGSRYLMIIDWSDFSAVNLNRAPKTPTPEFEICVLAAMFFISVILIVFCARKKTDIKV